MLTADELQSRREAIRDSEDLTALMARLSGAARPLLTRQPPLPEEKALLSADGGVCSTDRQPLSFDPWTPNEHRCSACGASVTGERHRLHWMRFQHLWLAERMAHLATVGVLGDEPGAAAKSAELLRWYGERYTAFPNVDNVLGPSRLFFSTYLESLWMVNAIAAGFLLREASALDQEAEHGISTLAEEGARLIGEYNEGLSNRQTWNNAALLAIAVWFEDEALAQEALEGPTGLLAHLLQGFGSDGMWYEGENYHLFALRGLLTGLAWGRLAGVEIAAEAPLAARLGNALIAPAESALPDATFPARKDARFGVSLAQPMYLETWEAGLASLGDAVEEQRSVVASWLSRLYQEPAPKAEEFESYLHEVALPRQGDGSPRHRSDLSWWMALVMEPALPRAPSWQAPSKLFEQQGLAVLRHSTRYVSLECGRYGGGHGHPDRLHLTLHADGVHWLRDYGTGSYVSPTLSWYRSTLAHNAPRLDGHSQTPGDATCEAFEDRGAWGWVRGRFQHMTRTVVSGPAYVLDILDIGGPDHHSVELPWHLAGAVTLETPGAWHDATLADQHVSEVEVYRAAEPGPLVLRAEADDRLLLVVLSNGIDLIRGRAPGSPPESAPATFYLVRTEKKQGRLVSLLAPSPGEGIVPVVELRQDAIDIRVGEERHRHRASDTGWLIETGVEDVRLEGMRLEPPAEDRPLLDLRQSSQTHATAHFIPDDPPVDGTLNGFDLSSPLLLDHDDQYRRSEEPYPGPESFSAEGYLNWNNDGLYIGVTILKSEVCIRAADAPPLLLDNEVDDIHSDGIQVYVALPGADQAIGLLAVPRPGDGERSLSIRRVGGALAEPDLAAGRWAPTDDGYCVTLRITPPWLEAAVTAETVSFDLVVNEMRPGRQRRAGQLVWTGGGGWVWLRGDRHDPSRFGTVDLAL